MAEFFVPVIHNEKTYLYQVRIKQQNITLGDFTLCGENKGSGNIAIDDLIDKISVNYGAPLTPVIDLLNTETGDCLHGNNVSSSTQSICLGLLTAVEFVQNKRILKERWDSVVITGDFDRNNMELSKVEQISKKMQALENLSARNPESRILFIYVSDNAFEDNELSKFPSNVEFKFFKYGTKISDYWAELFRPQFDEKQKAFLKKAASFNKSAEFVSNSQFEMAKKESRSENWNGYFIYGEGESGKTMFAYNLCTYLMSVKDYYAPIWISLNNNGLEEFARQKDHRYNGLSQKICTSLLPYWSEFQGLDEILRFLNQGDRKFLIVIDNLEMASSNAIIRLLRETFSELKNSFSVIITSRYDSSDLELEKTLSIKSINAGGFTQEECKKIALSNNPALESIPKEKLEKFYSVLSEKYQNAPGIIAFSSKDADEDSIDSKIDALDGETGSIQDYEGKIIESSFKQLSEELKDFLYCFVKKYYEKWFLLSSAENEWALGIKDFTDEFDYSFVKNAFSVLENLGFIYSSGDNCCSIKSTFYKTLMLSDFGFAGKEKYIDIKMRLGTAVRNRVEKNKVEELLFELRKSGSGSVDFVSDRLEDAIKYNSELEILELLLDEVEFYGGKKADVINRKADEGESLLRTAINWNDNAEVLIFLFKNGGNPNIQDKIGGSLFHDIYLDIPNFEAKCNILIGQGLDVNVKDAICTTPLMHLTKYGTKDQMSYFIKRGADVNARDLFGKSALHDSVLKGDREKIQLLLDSGAKLDSKDNYGYQPVHYAIHNFEIFSFLVELGADIKAQTYDGESLLDLVELGPYIDWNPSTEEELLKWSNFEDEYAVYEFLKKHKVKRFFRPKGFSYNWLSEKNDRISLDSECCFLQDGKVLYVARDSFDLLKEDLDFEENLVVRLEENRTLLHYAVLNPDIRVAEYLLEKGFGVNVKDSNGTTPVLLAAQYASDINIFELLIEYGADIKAVDNEGNGILHYAARNILGKNAAESMAEYFLNLGCDSSLRNHSGFLPIGIASKSNPDMDVFFSFVNVSTLDERLNCYFDNNISINCDELMLSFNPFCTIVSMFYELSACSGNLKLQDMMINERVNRANRIKDDELKDFVIDSADSESQKQLVNVRLYSSIYNDNPKLPVLWARQGGDLSFEISNGKTILDALRDRPDWAYIKKQLIKHKLIGRNGKISK